MARQKAKPDGMELIAEAIRHALTSPNVTDDNYEAANLVDTTQRIASGTHKIAAALERVAEAIFAVADRMEALE